MNSNSFIARMACDTTHNTILNGTGGTNSLTFSTWYTKTSTALNRLNKSSAANPNALSILETDIRAMQACVNQKGSSKSGGRLANTIFTQQEKILDLNDQISQEETNISIAKDRVKYIRNPEQKTSNYESWFPIDHRLHKISILILIFLSIFIGTFFILILLNIFGINIILFNNISNARNSSPWLLWAYSQVTYTSVALSIALIIIVWYFLNRR